MAQKKRANGKSRSRKRPVKDLGARTARNVRGSADKSSTKLFMDAVAGDLSASVKFKY